MLLLRTPTPSLWTFSARWLHRYLASPPPPSSLASSSLGSPYIGISRLTSTFVAILAFVFTYITVVCRGTSPSPPSSLPIYLSAFAHPPPATLVSAPSPLAHCPLLAARCCCNLLHMLETSHIGTRGSNWHCTTPTVTSAVPQLLLRS